jgi:hypothetical protein
MLMLTNNKQIQQNIRVFGMLWTFPSQILLLVGLATFYRFRYDFLMI